VATERSRELRDLAQRVADALPPAVVDEVVLTGSVSRGHADEVSDIEMLIVTREPLELAACFELARAAGLENLDTWGEQGTPTRRVSGILEGVPLELIWWSREYAEASVDGFFESGAPSAADAIVHGVSLRTSGALARWQGRLGDYPEELARARIEDAALTWGGFTPAGLLTLARPGELLARTERMMDDATRVLQIVYALNRVWQPTHKRLAARVAPLAAKPDRLAERIEEAFLEPDPSRALLAMTELQLDAALLAPDGPNIVRARTWLSAGASLLRARQQRGDEPVRPPVHESPLVSTDHGLVPEGQGWFVVNARETQWWDREGRGVLCEFEGSGFEGAADFPQLGVNISILAPGEPMAMYHWEVDQEDFLVLAGRALAILEGEERPLRPFDFVHCPPGTRHVIVGAGEEPCVVLAVGARDRSRGEDWGAYTVDEAAQRHGAGAERETSDPAEAYARFPRGRLTRYRDDWLPDEPATRRTGPRPGLDRA
jgi:uncharacterized cupin superfamily protein/predicted nucleotidyltransferase